MRNFSTIFHNGYFILHYHQQYTKVSFIQHSCQHSLFIVFLLIVIWQVWTGICLWFWFAFPCLVILSIFSCTFWPSVYLHWKNVYWGLLLVFWLGFLFFSVELNINPLSVASFANIFFHSVGCLFISLVVSFAVQKLWSLISPVTLLFLLFLFPSETDPRKHCYNLCESVSCRCFSLGVLYSSLTLRSLIHFEFIFVYSVRECSNFIGLHVAVQFSQHFLLKRLSFPLCIFLPPLS